MATLEDPTSVDSPAWRRFRRLLVGLIICRGLVYLCILPPFEAWDEYQHVGYVEHLRQTGRTPILNETAYPTKLLSKVIAFPQCHYALEQIGHLGAVGYADYWGRGGRERFQPIPRRIGWVPGPVPLYQAQHGPLAYRLALPFYVGLGGAAELRRSVGGLRLLNVLLTGASAWVAIGAIGRLMRSRRDAALVGLLIALHPLFLLNGARVANDALGVFLATLTIASALELPGRRPLLSGLGVGLLAGLAIAAKTVHFGILPFLGICWLLLVVGRREIPRGRSVLVGLAMAVGCGLVIGPDLRWNLQHYGMPTIMQEALVNRRNGKTGRDLLTTALGMNWRSQLLNLWLRWSMLAGGWSFLDTSYRWVWRYRHLVVLSLIGWGWLVRPSSRRRPSPFRSGRTPWAIVALGMGYTVALAGHMVQSTLAWGTSSTNSWYACATTPWYLALIVGGALCWPVGRLRFAAPIALAVTFASAEGILIWGAMIPTYGGGVGTWEALRRIATLQPSALGTATLVVAEVGTLILFARGLVGWWAWPEVEPPRGITASMGWRTDLAQDFQRPGGDVATVPDQADARAV